MRSSSYLLSLALLTLAPVPLMGIHSCNGGDQDMDGDGWTPDQGDCDDDDAGTYPGAPEVCDKADNDCDGEIDEDLVSSTWYQDADYDLYGNPDSSKPDCAAPSGYVANDEDCDDSNSSVHPGAPELCDDMDNDCDGEVDVDAQYTITWYSDQDGDTFGDTFTVAHACAQPAGYVLTPGDCADLEPAVHPGVLDVCDGLDNDCDGAVDNSSTPRTWFLDPDGDGFGDSDTAVEGCAQPGTGYVRARGDCGDTDPAIHPGAEDIPGDDIDGDCGGTDDADPHVGLSSSSFGSLQEALDLAAADATVWVGPGTYAGQYLSGSARLAATHMAEQTLIDASDEDSDEPLLWVDQLDGFTVRGHGSLQPYYNPYDPYYTETPPIPLANCILERAAMSFTQRSLQVNHTTFVDGGISCTQCDIELTDSSFPGSSVSVSGSGASVVMSYCTIAGSPGPGLYVGGEAYVDHSRFLANQGGGIYVGNQYSDSLDFDHCLIGYNSDDTGAGIQTYSGGLAVSNSLILRNNARFFGGAIYSDYQGSLVQSAVVGNTAQLGGGFYTTQFSTSTCGSVLAYNSNYNSYASYVSYISYDAYRAEPGADRSARATSDCSSYFYNPPGSADDPDGTSGTAEPGFLAYAADGVPSDVHLASGSPLIDANADNTIRDVDGSRGDIGLYGGAAGDAWDQDMDGVPDYFWPGTIADAPWGFDPVDYDADDTNPAVQ